MEAFRYSTGKVIVLREMWDGKIWGIHPEIVVQDTPQLLVLYRPAGICLKQRVSFRGGSVSTLERKLKKWTLTDVVIDSFCALRLKVPGEAYSVLAFFNPNHDGFRNWYINLETPFKRTSIGFDYTDYILDVIIDHNLKDWHWDDEDELQEAIDAGLISHENASLLYKKGEEVRDLIMSGKSVFNPWEHWRPDPSWEIPVLPIG